MTDQQVTGCALGLFLLGGAFILGLLVGRFL